jgi:hypothetical protein
VQEALLAAVRPGNTPHGYNWTFAFPMLMFIIVAGSLYLRFRGSHNVPGHVAMSSSRWAGGGAAGTVSAGSAEPAGAQEQPDTAGTTETAAEQGQAQPADEGTEDGE